MNIPSRHPCHNLFPVEPMNHGPVKLPPEDHDVLQHMRDVVCADLTEPLVARYPNDPSMQQACRDYVRRKVDSMPAGRVAQLYDYHVS